MSHASYLSKIFNRKEQDKVISEIKQLIKEKELKFDGFIVTGISGITMGSVLSRVLRKDLVIVRKANDGTHSSYNVENYKHDKSYIFLDDLIASGATYKNVKKMLSICKSTRWLYGDGKQSKIIGCIFYDPVGSDTSEYWTLQRVGKKIKGRL
jgi:adenine/guanine phosphoribosyltransferase-like PRPP-binding protein